MPEDLRLWPAWPAFGLNDDIRPALAEAQRQRTPVAIATLFHSEGGSPRGVGAQMVVGDNILAGHVSGGCIESDVANHCYAAIARQTPLRLIYGRGGPWDLPLPCGGRIELLIEPVPVGDNALAALLEFSQERQACMWTTDGLSRSCAEIGDAGLASLADAGCDGSLVYRLFVPRTRLIVIGNDPTALAIAGMAAAMELDVFFMCPGGPAMPPPIPEITYSRAAPADALGEIGIDRWTAVAACTHDPDLDHIILLNALATRAFFVGALGSERRREGRFAALRVAGLNDRAIARLKTPIGLNIGARAPREIAAATLAQIFDERRRTFSI